MQVIRLYYMVVFYLNQIIKPVNSGAKGNPISYEALSGETEFRANQKIGGLIDLKSRSCNEVYGVSGDGEMVFEGSKYILIRWLIPPPHTPLSRGRICYCRLHD